MGSMVLKVGVLFRPSCELQSSGWILGMLFVGQLHKGMRCSQLNGLYTLRVLNVSDRKRGLNRTWFCRLMRDVHECILA